MEDFEEIDLQMVPVGEESRFAARGWVLVSRMRDSKHGDWSVLMEREVAPPGAAGGIMQRHILDAIRGACWRLMILALASAALQQIHGDW